MSTYILDTHVLLWWFEDPQKLSSQSRTIIENPKCFIYLSSVVTWEISVKAALGKLDVPDKLFDLIKEGQFHELPVSIAHTQVLRALPSHHSDPFDRLLVAQALAENSTLITRDAMVQKYDIDTIKA